MACGVRHATDGDDELGACEQTAQHRRNHSATQPSNHDTLPQNITAHPQPTNGQTTACQCEPCRRVAQRRVKRPTAWVGLWRKELRTFLEPALGRAISPQRILKDVGELPPGPTNETIGLKALTNDVNPTIHCHHRLLQDLGTRGLGTLMHSPNNATPLARYSNHQSV